MANFGHIGKLQGLLKLASIVTALIAAGVGTNAFINSEYNKGCRNSDPLPPTHPTTSGLGTELITSSEGAQTEPSSGATGRTTLRWRTTENPGRFKILVEDNEEEEHDMAPVLWMERFHLGVCYIALIGSVIFLALFMLSERLEFSKTFKTVNFGYHFIWTIVLIVSAIFMAYAAIEIDRQICKVHQFEKREDCQKYIQKMSSAGFALLTAVLYGVLSFTVVSSKLYEQV